MRACRRLTALAVIAAGTMFTVVAAGQGKPGAKPPAAKAPAKPPAPAAKAPAAKPAPVAAKPAPAKPVPVAAKPVPAKPEPAKPVAKPPEPKKPEPTKPVAKPPEPKKPEPTKPEPKKPTLSKDDEAKEAFKAGKKAYDDKKYAEALPHFQRADELVPGSAPKYMIAECLDKTGKHAEAVAAYKAFVDSKPTGKYAEKIADANARVTALAATLPATIHVEVMPPNVPALSVSVDGRPQTGTQFTVPAGTHSLVVTGQGYQPRTESVTVKGNEKKDLIVALQPVPGVVTPPPTTTTTVTVAPAKGGNLLPGAVTLGVAGAVGIVGGVFGGLALADKGDFKTTPTTAAADKTERDARIADICFGVAGGTAIVGIVLLVVVGKPGSSQEKASIMPTLAPSAGPNGGGMAATWKF